MYPLFKTQFGLCYCNSVWSRHNIPRASDSPSRDANTLTAMPAGDEGSHKPGTETGKSL